MAIKNRTDLQTAINTDLPDNTVGAISPADTRGTQTDLNDSSFNTQSDDTDTITEGTTNLFLTAALTTTIGTAEQAVNKAAANGYASLGADSKIPVAQLPAISIVDYLGVAADQSAMLLLTGEKGDFCVRTDTGTNFQIIGDDPTDVTDWLQMSYPTAPVTSVNSASGVVVLDAGDIAETATRLYLNATTQTFTGNKTVDGTLTATGLITSDLIKSARPVGTIITSSANLESIPANTFYDVNANGGAIVITVTDQANTDFPIGAEWEFSPVDLTNNISFVAGGSTSIDSVDSNLKLDKAFSGTMLKKTANNTFRLIGTLKS